MTQTIKLAVIPGDGIGPEVTAAAHNARIHVRLRADVERKRLFGLAQVVEQLVEA